MTVMATLAARAALDEPVGRLEADIKGLLDN